MHENVLWTFFHKEKKYNSQKWSSRNHIKRQKSATFAEKKFFKKDADDEKYFKARYHCSYTGKYRGASQSICKVYVKKFQ